MATETIVLTDTESGASFSTLDDVGTQAGIEGDAAARTLLSGNRNWSISQSTLRGGLSEGVEVVWMNNGQLAIAVLPTRGMGIWKAEFRGIPVEWKSPVRLPVHPGFVNLKERNGLGWLNGFNELMCRCGLSYHGPPGVDQIHDGSGNVVSEAELTLHGRIANLPAHRVVAQADAETGTLSVTGTIDESSLFGPVLRLESTVSTQADSSVLTIQDRVTNLGGQPTEFELLYHTNFGRPFLGEGSQIVAPVGEIAPRDAHSASGLECWQSYPAPCAGVTEEAFFLDLQADSSGQTGVLLRNAAGDRGVTLIWQKSQLPCFTLWKNPQAEADGYVTGLEPGTSLPNLKSFERQQGRLITLPPGGSYESGYTMQVYDSESAVTAAAERVMAIQTARPVVHTAPVSKYSP